MLTYILFFFKKLYVLLLEHLNHILIEYSGNIKRNRENLNSPKTTILANKKAIAVISVSLFLPRESLFVPI